MSNNLIDIYVDMDGVIANSWGTVQKEFNIQNVEELIKGENEVLKNEIHKNLLKPDFFLRVLKYNSSDDLIDLVLKYTDSYYILSAPIDICVEEVKRNKTIWMKNNFSFQPKKIIFECEKDIYAVKITDGKCIPNILIDNRKKNCDKFSRAGGIAIRYSADYDTLDYLENELKKIYSV